MAEIKIIEIKDKTFRIELVRREKDRIQGLMFLDSIPNDYGMLFVYQQENESDFGFWMKNTRIPLDIIYLDKDFRVINICCAYPCKTDPCPVYRSEKPWWHVLEVNMGISKKLGLKPGDRLNFGEVCDER